jgi:CP family cyanate transporter-like MFS transporter
VLPLVDGSWRLSFLIWALPVLLTAAIVALSARSLRAAGPMAPTVNARWWPDFRSPLIWRLGLILGSVNAIYFASNAFLPDFVIAQGRPDLVGPALTALNVGQLPAAFVMLVFAGVLGFTDALTLILALALPSVLSAPDDVHRTSAGMFTISYSCAMLAAVSGGALWDMTRMPIMSFAPVALCGIVIAALAGTVRHAAGKTS